MKLLLKTVLQNRRHYLLMVFTLISMLSMTIASQLEILSIGVLTNSGSDFFKLFGFFVGQVMREGQGKLSPNLVNKLLKDALNGSEP